MKILFLTLSTVLACHAQAGNPCDQAMTTPEMNQCAQQEHQQADKKLNAAYQAALKRIDAGLDDEQQRKATRQGLVEAQRFWVQFRDKDCGAEYDWWRGGTIRGVMYWGCMTNRTEKRTKELEQFASGAH